MTFRVICIHKFPVYYAKIAILQLDDSDVYEHDIQGGCSVKFGEVNLFGRISHDET